MKPFPRFLELLLIWASQRTICSVTPAWSAVTSSCCRCLVFSSPILLAYSRTLLKYVISDGEANQTILDSTRSSSLHAMLVFNLMPTSCCWYNDILIGHHFIYEESSFINPLAHVLECIYVHGILFKLYCSVFNSNNRLWTGFTFNYSLTSFVFQAFRQWERLLSLGKCLELSV